MADRKKCAENILSNLKERGLEYNKEQLAQILEEVDAIRSDPDYAKKFKGYRELTKKEIEYRNYLKADSVIKQKQILEMAVDPKVMDQGNYNAVYEAMVETTSTILENNKNSFQNTFHSARSRLRNFYEEAMGDLKKIAMDRSFEKELFVTVDNLNKGLPVGKVAKEVLDAANAIRKTNKYIIQSLEKAGITVKERMDYIVRQTHDGIKISSSSKDEWAQFIYNKLDHNKTFGNVTDQAKQMEVLNDIYDEITSFDYTSGMGALGQKRSLHFKDGAALADYHQLYGQGNFLEIMERSMDAAARSEAMFTKFGSNPDKMWDDVEKKMLNMIRETKGEAEAARFMDGNIGGMKNHRDNMKKNIFGFDKHPNKNMGAKFLSGLQGLQAISKLGMSFFSTFTDYPIAVANYMAKTGVNYWDGHTKLMSSYMAGLNPKNRQKFAKLLQVHFDSQVGRFGESEGFGGTWRKVVDGTMRLTGLEWTTKNNQLAGGISFASHLADNSNLKFTELDPRLQAELKNFGLDKHWDKLKDTIEDVDGLQIVTPEKMPTRELENKLANFIGHNTRMSAPMPGIRTRASINQGLSPNTLQGQALRAVLQFKGFPLEIGKVIKEISTADPSIAAQSMKDAFKSKSNMGMFGMLMAEGVVFAGLGLMARDIAAGKKPRDMSDPKNIAEAITRGVLPLQFEFMINTAKGEYANVGRSILKDLAGPTFGQMDDIVRLMSRAANGDKFANRALEMIKRNVPLNNNPLVEPVLNKVFLEGLHEYINPGYMLRKKVRARERGTEYYIPFLE